jgi:hypothetical protein
LYPADCGFGLMFGRHEILPIVRCTVSVEINMPVLHGHVWFPCSLYALTIGLPWFRCNVGKVNGVLLLYINMFSCVLSCEIGMRSFRVTAQFPSQRILLRFPPSLRYMIMHSITLWGVAWIYSFAHVLFPPMNQSTSL